MFDLPIFRFTSLVQYSSGVSIIPHDIAYSTTITNVDIINDNAYLSLADELSEYFGEHLLQWNSLECIKSSRAIHAYTRQYTNEIIGSDNGLTPVERQARYLYQCWLIVNRATGNKFQWNLNSNITIFIKKMNMKLTSAKWRPFCVGLNVSICGGRRIIWLHISFRIRSSYIIIGGTMTAINASSMNIICICSDRAVFTFLSMWSLILSRGSDDRWTFIQAV